MQKISDTDIAIIGISCRFPGAENTDEFWDNLEKNKEAITFFTHDELENGDAEIIKDPNFVKAGSIMGGAKSFDAQFFGFSEQEAKILDPQHRKFLESSWEAFEDGGYDPFKFKGSIGVFAGSGMSTYFINNVHPNIGYHPNRTFLESMGDLQLLTANDRDYLATRVAYKLNLRGPSINIQTACSTSLVAVHLACQSIINGECDMALAGAVTVLCPQKTGYLYQPDMILSPDGHCRPYDAKAKGTVFGSGVGVVLLKKLSDAIRDGDAIHAVVKGTAVNNDGSNRVGHSAPGINGQAAVIDEALAVANLKPKDITFVEGHGTATRVGDLVEIAALKQVFHGVGNQHCALGSVKSNVGHLGWASGMAGLIKTVLALKHKKIPATIHYESSAPEADLGNSPFYVNKETEMWKTDKTRTAGVSAFGLGGTNSHVIVGESPETKKIIAREDAAYLFPLSARSEPALKELASRYLRFLDKEAPINLRDFCYTASVGRKHFEKRIGFISTSLSNLKEQLDGFLNCRSMDEFLKTRREFEKLFERNDLGKLMQLRRTYETGTNLDWKVVYPKSDPHRVHLPAYPFQEKEYWLESHSKSNFVEQSLEDKSWLKNFYEVTYKEQPLYGSATKYLLDTVVLMETIKSKASDIARSNGIEYYQEKLKILEQSAYQFIVNAFYELGFSFDQKNITTEEFVKEFSIVPQYRKLVDRLFAILQQEEIVVRDGNKWRVLKKPIARAVFLPKSDLAEFDLLGRCGIKLVDVLRGFENPIDLLFPNGDTTLLKKLYVESPTLKTMNALIAESVAQLERNLPRKVGLRILEIGAGTGSTTTSILNKLFHNQSSYTFTDISKRFITDAKEQFSNYSFVSYGQLDIEKGGEDEGFVNSRYDIVIATNVLHATKDLRKTLENVHRLLTPGGRLILLEGTAPVRWIDITFGLSDGWWRFSDHSLRQSYPLLSNQEWQKELTASGFSEVAILSSEDVGSAIGSNGGLPQSIIFAKRNVVTGVNSNNWLVFADDTGFGDSLVRRLSKAGNSCVVVKQGDRFKVNQHGAEYVINAMNVENFDQLFNGIQTTQNIVYLWSLNKGQKDEPTDTSKIRDQYLHNCCGLLNVVKASVRKLTIPPSLFVVTRGAQMLNPQARLDELLQSAVWGMSKVIAIEHPELHCKIIDIESSKQENDIFNELCTIDKETQVLLREDERYVLRMVHKNIMLDSFGDHTFHLKNEGVYIITGGLGGLGLKTAEWLSSNGARHIILVGHREPASDVKKSIDFLRSGGVDVRVMQCDVSDLKAVGNLFSELKHIGPIKGIIHAAGAIDDGVLLQQNSERFQIPARAKVLGSWNLHVVSAEEKLNLDFFVVFSSVVSSIGNVGQSNHAAANGFMNSLISYRRLQNLPATVIQWGAWAHIGTLARYPEVVDKLKTRGIGLIQPDEGIKALALVLRKNISEIIYAPVAWGQFIESNNLRDNPFFSLLVSDKAELPSEESPIESDAFPEIANLSEPDKTNFIKSRVEHYVGQVLGIRRIDGIDDADFFDYGMDSLTSIQLRNSLQSDFKCILHPTVAYKYSSINKLSKHIANIITIDTKETGINNVIKSRPTSSAASISMQQNRWLMLAEKNYGRLLIPILFYSKLDQRIFRAALEQVINRHEVLKYKFQNGNAIVVAVQDFLPNDQELFVDASKRTEQAQIIKAQANKLRSFPPNPQESPAWTIKCITLNTSCFLVLLHIQHLEFDGASVSIFIDDLRRFYVDFMSGIDATYLPSVQYSDYVEWQKRYINSDLFLKDRGFFVNLFSGVKEPTFLPNHSGRKITESYPSSCYTPTQVKGLWQKLQLIGKELKVSPFAILCATYGQVIGEIVQKDEVVIGTIASSRPSSEFDKTIGPFVQPFPMKVLITENFKEMVLRIHNLITEINGRSRYPVTDMISHISVFNGMGMDTYFTDPFIMLNNYPREENMQPRVEVLESLGPIIKEGLPDLTQEKLNEIAGLFFIIDYFEGEMRFNFWYHIHRFSEGQIKKWSQKYLAILKDNIRKLGS